MSELINAVRKNLKKNGGLFLSGSDAYVNVIGGMRLDERAIDLPVVLAIGSSYRDQPIPEGVMAFGEIGLTGELRAVSAAPQRIREALRLGFHTCIMPKQEVGKLPEGIRVIQVSNIAQAFGAVFQPPERA